VIGAEHQSASLDVYYVTQVCAVVLSCSWRPWSFSYAISRHSNAANSHLHSKRGWHSDGLTLYEKTPAFEMSYYLPSGALFLKQWLGCHIVFFPSMLSLPSTQSSHSLPWCWHHFITENQLHWSPGASSTLLVPVLNKRSPPVKRLSIELSPPPLAPVDNDSDTVRSAALLRRHQRCGSSLQQLTWWSE